MLAIGLYAVPYRSRETNRAASTAVKIQMILLPSFCWCERSRSSNEFDARKQLADRAEAGTAEIGHSENDESNEIFPIFFIIFLSIISDGSYIFMGTIRRLNKDVDH